MNIKDLARITAIELIRPRPAKDTIIIPVFIAEFITRAAIDSIPEIAKTQVITGG